MNQSTTPAQGSILYVIGISLIAALGGFLFGFDMVVVSGAIKPLTELFHLDPFWKGWATICVITVIFVWKCIPETKGKSLEEIEIQLVGIPAGSTRINPD